MGASLSLAGMLPKGMAGAGAGLAAAAVQLPCGSCGRLLQPGGRLVLAPHHEGYEILHALWPW